MPHRLQLIRFISEEETVFSKPVDGLRIFPLLKTEVSLCLEQDAHCSHL